MGNPRWQPPNWKYKHSSVVRSAARINDGKTIPTARHLFPGTGNSMKLHMNQVSGSRKYKMAAAKPIYVLNARLKMIATLIILWPGKRSNEWFT